MKLVALFLLTACAPLINWGNPSPPVSICSRTNTRPVRVEVLVEDDWHPPHLQWVGIADPKGHACTTWTLPGERGRFGYVVAHQDTTWEPFFWASAIR